jgi:hypothetical protein
MKVLNTRKTNKTKVKIKVYVLLSKKNKTRLCDPKQKISKQKIKI